VSYSIHDSASNSKETIESFPHPIGTNALFEIVKSTLDNSFSELFSN
jgi:hypothetical protein